MKSLLEEHVPRVWRFALRLTGDRHQAEDLTQEIFFKLYGALPKYDPEKNFTAWLVTLAKNHLIDEYRRTKWEKKRRDDFDERFLAQKSFDDPEESYLSQESRRLVWEGLNRLSPEMRMAIILRDLQGGTYEEIAESLGLPLGTVKSRVNRARLQLAQVLRERKGEIR